MLKQTIVHHFWVKNPGKGPAISWMLQQLCLAGQSVALTW